MTGCTQPTVFVVYGASGDLFRRLVLPGFFELARRDLLPEHWRLIGQGRGKDLDLVEHVRGALEEFGPAPADGPFDEFAARLLWAGGGIDVDDAGDLPAVLQQAREALAADGADDDAQLVHYLAIPPSAFLDYTKAIAAHDLAEGSRIVYEKPYGTSLATFEELETEVKKVFTEDQVFRIDHFLAFEAVQNVLHARFANPWLAGIWNADHVAQVQIDVAETLDVAQRAEFYDATGAFLDMIVTHLFQMAATVALVPPADLTPEKIQEARDAALQRFRPLDPAEVVLGQFDGYLDIDDVADDSQTDTLAALKLWVDDETWSGVPFLLRSGKKMAADEQRITLVLKTPVAGPYSRADAGTDLPGEPAAVSFSLLEGGAIDVRLVVRTPGVDGGTSLTTATAPLDGLDGQQAALPYVHLIEHVLTGNRSLFTGVEGLRAAWTAVQEFSENRPAVQPYAPGTWGPDAVDALAEPGRWYLR